MTGQLRGKVAVVTGAASGIGKAAVELFVAEGAKVVAADISDELGGALESLRAGSIVYVHTDVTSEADIERAVQTAVTRFGRLDVMYNNAGALGDPATVLEATPEGFDRTIALVARSVLLGTKHAARQILAQGTPGAIVNTSSVAGIQGGWNAAGYTAGKHAIIGITRQAAAELGGRGIRVNAIAPGIIRTPILARSFGIPVEEAEAFSEFFGKRYGIHVPVGRFGLPEDIAQAALWLASDASSFVTGIVLPVDGGASAVHRVAEKDDFAAALEAFRERRTTSA
ncbi:glucose 1-dehydrogenase [Microbacterium sp. LMI12-1-1.1]|uniref:SDR family NAD(P)-dependent oxidoreductase n=1 Tax=Microbacterium sp. LMI12-1-1.1 TaxID=3135225 RepID=UPI00341DD2E2